MKNLFYLFAFLLMTTILFSNFQCGKEDDFFADDEICEAEHRFAQLDIEVTPEQSEYLRGDTIWFSAEFDAASVFSDINTINFDTGAGLLNVYILDLLHHQDISNGYDRFDYINVEGELRQNGINYSVSRTNRGDIFFECNQGICSFKIGMTTTHTANYCVAFYLGFIVEGEGGCQPNISFDPIIFDINSHNKELLEPLGITSTVHINGGGISDYDIVNNDGAYIFKVH